MDTTKLRELCDKRDALDEEITALVTGSVKERKTIHCSLCDGEGHTARTCKKPPDVSVK